jgi:hypothetical protein
MDSDDERYHELLEVLRDLVWLNAVITTELVQITENTSSIMRGCPPPESCLTQHQAIRDEALRISERYSKDKSLREHICGHQ